MKVRESPLRDVLRILVWYPVRWAILAMPLPAAIRSLRCMGDLHCAFSRGRRRHLQENLERLDIHADGDAVVRLYFRTHYLDQLFVFVAPRFDAARVAKLVSFEGREHLDRALEQGRGCILVHGHFGPAHLPLVALARLGYEVRQVGNPSDEGLSWIGRHVAYRLRMRYERKMPVEIFPARAYLGPVFRSLRRNGVIMITGDGSGTERHIGLHRRFRFFGLPVLFPLGPARLSVKTGAPLLPMFVLPGTEKPFRVIIEPPIRSGGHGAPDPVQATEEFVRRYEKSVTACPGYMHFLDRFHPGALIEPALSAAGD